MFRFLWEHKTCLVRSLLCTKLIFRTLKVLHIKIPKDTHIHAHTCTRTHTHIYTYLPTYLPTYIHTYIHTLQTDRQTDRQTDMHACIIYIHTYIHTYIVIHTYIHTYIIALAVYSYDLYHTHIMLNLPDSSVIFNTSLLSFPFLIVMAATLRNRTDCHFLGTDVSERFNLIYFTFFVRQYG